MVISFTKDKKAVVTTAMEIASKSDTALELINIFL